MTSERDAGAILGREKAITKSLKTSILRNPGKETIMKRKSQAGIPKSPKIRKSPNINKGRLM